MSEPVKAAANYNDFAALTALRRDSKTGSSASIRETARQFEGLFTRMVLKSMREASFGDPIFGSDQSNFYRDMFDDQLSLQLSSGTGLGLADMLVRQLSQSGTATAATPEATAGTPSGRAAGGAGPGAGSGARAAAGAGAGAAGATRKSPYASPASPAAPAVSSDEAHAAFERTLWPSAVEAGQQLGVDPRTLIAHAALETGWGQSLPGDASGPCSHNLFGIKATANWKGDSVVARSVEFEAGLPTARTSRFRAYTSTADCFQDYVSLLAGDPRYARALGTGSDVQAFGNALAQAGYATDPNYSSKLAAVAATLKQLPEPPLTTSQGGP
jgi:flagellar protein FlgJ